MTPEGCVAPRCALSPADTASCRESQEIRWRWLESWRLTLRFRCSRISQPPICKSRLFHILLTDLFIGYSGNRGQISLFLPLLWTFCVGRDECWRIAKCNRSGSFGFILEVLSRQGLWDYKSQQEVTTRSIKDRRTTANLRLAIHYTIVLYNFLLDLPKPYNMSSSNRLGDTIISGTSSLLN